MGRSPCCEKVGLKKGPWTPEEDQKLLAYIEEHGHGSWRVLPAKAGLQRCGKSCRLRWTNYLRPDIKRGKFSLEEEQTIIQLHALLGNRWSAIATHLSKRTDNEIKNYWNTHLKKRLAKMGIDPVTHKPKSEALLSLVDGQSKNDANLSHMAQWESARLEAEARLVRESKLRSKSFKPQPSMLGSDSGQNLINAWQGMFWSKSTKGNDLESPTSTLSLSENSIPIPTVGILKKPTGSIEFVANSSTYEGELKEGGEEDLRDFGKLNQFLEDKERMDNSVTWASAHNDMGLVGQGPWTPESSNDPNKSISVTNFIDGFTDLLLNNSDDRNSSDGNGHSDNADGNGSDDNENKNYWNSILNLVNSSPLESPIYPQFAQKLSINSAESTQ